MNAGTSNDTIRQYIKKKMETVLVQLLARYDTYHDFNHTGDRRATMGLKVVEPGFTGTGTAILPNTDTRKRTIDEEGNNNPPRVQKNLKTTPSVLKTESNSFKLTMGNARLYSGEYNNDNCTLEAHSNGGPKGVSYERRVTAAFDECKLENSWTDSNIIRWDDIFNKKDICWSSGKWVYPEGNVLVIGNNEGETPEQQGDMYGPAIRGDEVGAIGSAAYIKIMKNRNLLALYIFGFLFPGKEIAEGMGITYDAGGGDVTKIFSGIPQATAIITPQNISDSANTMLNPFIDYTVAGSVDRTEFIFPTDLDDPVAGIKEYTYKSQIYSKEWCTIKIKNKDYSNTNKNGFIIEFSMKDTVGVIATIDYNDSFELLRQTPSSAKSMQGSSAPYLSEVIEFILSPLAGHDPKNVTVRPMKPIIMPVNKLVKDIYTYLRDHGETDPSAKDKISGLLFDLKRSGDYEQANAAKWLRRSMNIILSTGDVLCSTYARKLEIPCILGGIGTNSGLGSHAIAVFRTKEDARGDQLPPLTNYSAPTEAGGFAVLPFLNALTYIQQNEYTKQGRYHDSANFLRAMFYRLSCSGKFVKPAIFKPPQERNVDVVKQFFELYTTLLKIKFYKLYNEINILLSSAPTTADQNIRKMLSTPTMISLLRIINDPEKKRAKLLKIRNERHNALETLWKELGEPENFKDEVWLVMNVYGQMMNISGNNISNINTQFKKHDISLDDCENFFDCTMYAIPMFSKKMLYEHVTTALLQNATNGSSSSTSTGQAVSVNHIKVNNFLVSIGLDIPLFYEVFKKYYDFLGGMAIKLKINKERVIKFNNKTKFNFSALSDQFPQEEGDEEKTSPIKEIKKLDVGFNQYFTTVKEILQNIATKLISTTETNDDNDNVDMGANTDKSQTVTTTTFTPERIKILTLRVLGLDSVNVNKVLRRFNEKEIQDAAPSFVKFVQTTLTGIHAKFEEFTRPPFLLLPPEQCNDDAVVTDPSSGSASAACQIITTWWRSMRGGSIQQKGGAPGNNLNRIAVLTIKNMSANCDDFIIEQINNVVDNKKNPIILYWFRLFSTLFNLYETLNIYNHKVPTMVEMVEVTGSGRRMGDVREFAEGWKGKRESFRTLGISLISIQQQISILNIQFPNSCLHLLPINVDFLKSTVEVFKNVLQTRDLQTYVNLKDLPFHHQQASATSYMSKWSANLAQFDKYDIKDLLTKLFTFTINGTKTSLKKIFSEATTNFDGFMLPTASGNSSPDIMLDKMELKAPVVRSSKAFMKVIQTLWVDALLEAIDLEPNIEWKWGVDNDGDRICPTFTNIPNINTFSGFLFGQQYSNFIRSAAFLHNTFQLKSSAFNPFTFSPVETANAQNQFNTENNTIAVENYWLNNFENVFTIFSGFPIDVPADPTFEPKIYYIVETLNINGAFLRLAKKTAGGGSKRGRTKRKKRKKRKTKKRRKKGKKTRKRKGKKKRTRRF